MSPRRESPQVSNLVLPDKIACVTCLIDSTPVWLPTTLKRSTDFLVCMHLEIAARSALTFLTSPGIQTP